MPSNRSDAVAFWNGSPYATPSSIVIAAEADRTLVLAGQMELAGQRPDTG